MTNLRLRSNSPRNNPVSDAPKVLRGPARANRSSASGRFDFARGNNRFIGAMPQKPSEALRQGCNYDRNLFRQPRFTIMKANDSFSRYYSSVIDDTSDVVDRIVINAWFRLRTTGGGFRYWWRLLQGTDDNPDDTHLMRMAGRFSRRVRGWAKKNDIPVVFCGRGERKHQIAEEHRPTDPSFRGVYAVLIKRAPAAVFEVLQFEGGGFHIRRK